MTKPRRSRPINLHEAANEVGCSETTLRRYIRDGALDVPKTRGGHYLFFDPEIRIARRHFDRNKNRR